MGGVHRWAAASAVAAVLAAGGCAAPGGGGGGLPGVSGLTGGAGPLTEDDGYVPVGGGLAVDADVPALTGLDPELLAAVREAAAAALDAGIDEVVVTGGWRSERYQEHLWEEAVREHGEEEARRWVASPTGSTHVSGDAVDIGYTNAADWFSRFGHEYGLCRTYANELWHYELAVEPGEPCPQPVADASARRGGAPAPRG
ncbi:D-alanyl-D-alanine carboxypeptidase family protein [Nocardiopsis flavescens]